jgi:pseudaminic acid biosynthesis-associated methylase
MATQVNVWSGEFGREYTDRNVVSWRDRLPAFREMLKDLPLRSVLEVGCNRGHNLVALVECLAEDAEIAGIEPNRYAREIARQVSEKAGVVRGTADDIPFKAASFDLVMTSCVLIHVALETLPAALDEIYRVSSRYILCNEYVAEAETPIHYRGHDDLLWKRDFLKHYQERFPDLRLVRSGFWGPEDGFDRTNWYLLEKTLG